MIKKLKKVEKLKNIIDLLRDDIESEKRRYSSLQGRYEEVVKQTNDFREMNNSNYEEIMWLRHLVELITVDKDKFEKLEAMRREREMRNKKNQMIGLERI